MPVKNLRTLQYLALTEYLKKEYVKACKLIFSVLMFKQYLNFFVCLFQFVSSF